MPADLAADLNGRCRGGAAGLSSTVDVGVCSEKVSGEIVRGAAPELWVRVDPDHSLEIVDP